MGGGVFLTNETAEAIIDGGGKKGVSSAPAKNDSEYSGANLNWPGVTSWCRVLRGMPICGSTPPGRRGRSPAQGRWPPGGGGIVAQLVGQAAAVLAHGVVDAEERRLLVEGLTVVADKEAGDLDDAVE